MDQKGNEKLEQLKDQYHDILVPDSAKGRIMAGIQQGKKGRRKRSMMKFTKKTGLTAAAALLAITLMANLSPMTAKAMESIPVIGTIAKVVTFRTFEESKDNYEAKIQVPQVSIGDQTDTEVNQSIADYANQLIADYESQVKKDLDGQGHYSVTSTYDVVTDNSKYLSLRIKTTVIMASGSNYAKIFTIDKATGKVVTLKDLFTGKPDTLSAISDNIKEQMQSQMAADENKQYFIDSQDDPEDDFKGLTGDESFYFNKDGQLVISFDEDTVAPAYMGVVEFTIPKSVTGDISFQ